MDNDLIKILEYFNLSETEAKVYLAALQAGKDTAYEIAKIANIKRPTTYALIGSLAEKGLMTTEKARGKNLCIPTPPRRLIEMWKGRVESLESISPELHAYYRQSKKQPKVQVFEGERGIDAVYNELITSRDTKNEEILAFGSVSAIKKYFHYLFPVWEKTVRNKRNTIRELANYEPGVGNYIETMRALGNPSYQLRVTHANTFGQCDNMVYKNKVAIFSLQQELFVSIIESAEIAKTYKAMFDMAWQNAAEPKKFNKK